VSEALYRHSRLATVCLGVGLAAAGLLLGLVVGRAPLPAAGVVVGALVLLLLVVEPRATFFGTVLVVTLLPFGVLPLPVGGVQFTLLDLLLTLSLVLWLMHLCLAPGQLLHVTPVGGLLLVFLAISAIACLNGLPNGIEVSQLRLYGRSLASALLLLAVLNLQGSVNEARWLALTLIAGGALAGCVGIALYILPEQRTINVLSLLGPLGYPTGLDVMRYLAESQRLRAIGTSIDPNFFGAMLMVCGVLAATQVPAPRPVANRWLLLLALGPIGLALLLSFSRSSWMGFAAGIAFVAAVRYRWLWLVLVPAVLLLFAGVIPGTQSFTGHLLAGFLAQDLATQMRLGEYKDALALIARYPWLGVGYGDAPAVDTYVGVSNIYLLLAENAGLVGLTAYLGVMVGLFAYCLPSAWRARDQLTGGLILSCLATVCGALVAGVFDHHFVNVKVPHILALFWLCAAVAVLLARLERERLREAIPLGS
jgi:polysaccharide biosynthesis protein PslJ